VELSGKKYGEMPIVWSDSRLKVAVVSGGTKLI
jgi:hypothetical protein